MTQKTGRPRKYEDRKAEAQVIFGRMAEGMSMRKSCKASGICAATLLIWINEEGLSKQYEEAREAMLDKWADDIMDISDEQVGSTDSGATDSGAIQRNRLRVDARKWLLSKLGPKKYGDRQVIAGDADAPLAIQEVRRVIVDQE